MFTGVVATLSGLFGSGVGLLQGIIDKKQETRRFEIEKQLDNERIKIENNTTIEVVKSGIDIEKYKSITSLHESNKAKYEQEKQEYSNFTGAVVDLTKVDISYGGKANALARFFTSFVRPFTTYLLLGILALFAYNINLFTEEMKMIFFEMYFAILDFVLGFWFVRRSYDKSQISNIIQKKKS